MYALPPLFRNPACLVVVAALLVPSAESQQLSHALFHPPAGVLVAGLRETATHRSAVPSLRITSDHGMPSSANFWLHLDAAGHVLEVKDIATEDYMHPHFDPNELIEAMRKVTYAPFILNGNQVESWAQDTAELLAREDATPQPKSPQTATPFPAPNPPTDFSISLSRSGCFGSCAAYSVTIHGDGTVSYKGSRFVSIEGERIAHATPQAARQLFDRFRDANFFALKNEYRAGVTDNPTYCLELVVGAKKKIITDYVGEWVGMPAAVTQLEDAVDQTADSARWVTASSQTLEAMRDAGISPSSKEGNQILLRAVLYGKPDSVRELLAAGGSTKPESKPKDRVEMWTPSGSLLEAATAYDRDDAESRKEVIAALLEIPAVRANKQDVQRALGKVAADGQLDIARMLIAAGADPQGLFQDTSSGDEKPADQTYLMRAVESGVWSMIDDALSRPHDIHAVDHDGRSALAMVVWTSPPVENILPLVDKLLAAGTDKKELDRALADACDHADWRDGLVARGASPEVCKAKKR